MKSEKESYSIGEGEKKGNGGMGGGELKEEG